MEESEQNQKQGSKDRFFGRRKGRPLRAQRAGLLETVLPTLLVRVPESGELDLTQLFPQPINALKLEIGFGGGEHLLAQALAHPNEGFIGCEPFINGVAKLVTALHEKGAKNIRIYPEDARHVLDALPDHCLQTCFVLYADPWPKTRHAERRFIGPANLDRLARVMKAGGELRLATDVDGLAAWMREQCQKHPAFEEVYDGPQAPADWVPTRYEQKGIKAGRQPSYLVYRRGARI